MSRTLQFLNIKGSLQYVGFFLGVTSFILQSKGEESDLQISCKTPQYAEIGRHTSISCVFAPSISQVFWFKINEDNSSLLVALKNQRKSGDDGYFSGEYDIAENGSLIIRNVSLIHEGNYEVVTVDAKDITSKFTIHLITTGSFKRRHPYINICGNESFCLTEYNENNTLVCSSEMVNSAPVLEWYRIYSGGKTIVESVKYSQPSESSTILTVSTVAMSNLPRHMLQILSCEATWPSPRSTTLSATVVIDNSNNTLPSKIVNVKSESLMEFHHHTFICGYMDTLLISVWKKRSNEGIYHTVAYSYFDGYYTYTEKSSHNVTKNMFKFRPAQTEDEGTYYCMTADGLKTFYAFFRMNVQQNEAPACMTPQYAQINKRGYIFCNFPPPLSGAYWYYEQNGTDVSLITNEEKNDEWKTRHNAGNYDILKNGSLVIETVNIHNEGNYTVTFLTSNDKMFTFTVNLIATVPPKQSHPSVNICEGEKICLTEYGRKLLTCRMDDVRPAAEVIWYHHLSSNGEEFALSQQLTWSQSNAISTFSTSSVISLSALPDKLQVLTCKATWPSSNAQPLVTNVVVENFHSLLPLNESQLISVDTSERSKKSLLCGKRFKETSFTTVWKFSPSYSQSQFHDIAYTYYGSSGGYIPSPISVSILKGSLVIHPVDRNHNGIYVCIATDGIKQEITGYNVTVIRPPTPLGIYVEQCRSTHDLCQIFTKVGVISCHVSYVFPAVQLEIISDDRDPVKLINISTSVEQTGDTFNVSVRADYNATGTSGEQIVRLYCLASGKATISFDKRREILIVLSDTVGVKGPPADKSVISNILWIFIPASLFLVVSMSAMLCYKVVTKENQSNMKKEEVTSRTN